MVNVGQTSIRAWVRRFAEEMERQLRENDWKGDFQEMDFGDLLHRIDEELEELKTAIAVGATAADLVKESADVANFLAALARLAWSSEERPPSKTADFQLGTCASCGTTHVPLAVYGSTGVCGICDPNRPPSTPPPPGTTRTRASVADSADEAGQADAAEADAALGRNPVKYAVLYYALERIAAASAPDANGWHDPAALDYIHQIATTALEGRRDHDSA